jgi:hypothetical protein
LFNGGGVVATGTNHPSALQDDAIAGARHPPPQPIRFEVDVAVDSESIGLHATLDESGDTNGKVSVKDKAKMLAFMIARLADKQILAHEVNAWQDHRNKHHAKANSHPSPHFLKGPFNSEVQRGESWR